jgi:hypothetical protein
MKTSCFNDLSLTLKRKIIREFATPVVSIEYYDHRIDLFSLHTSLIECYQNISTGMIEKISEASYRDLEKYLSRIMIGNLKLNLKKR